VVALLLAGSLVAGACGGDGGENGGGSGGGSEEDAGDPTPGGKLVYGLEAENDEGWCLPEAQLAISGIQVARAIYDTLTAPNEDGEYVPFLAESVEPNDDFTEWEIKVREGVVFHDGSPLTAEVVKNNLDAFRGQYPTRSPLLFVFVFQNIADVQVVDDLTVKVTTNEPWPAFPATLFGSGRIGISAQAQLDNESTCDRELIGTGPFKFVEWRQNERLLTERNENYWQTDENGNQLPYLDELEFQPKIDAAARLNSLLSGEIQAMHTSNAESIDEIRALTDSGELNSYESTKFAEVSFGQLNSSVEPFNNKNARLAAITALDMETFNQVRNLGILTNANGPFAEGNMGYLEDTGYPTYDLEAAKGYVEAYKEETGKDLEFTLLSTNDESTRASAQLIQEMAEKAGMRVSLRDMSQSELIDNAIAGTFQAMAFRNYPGGDPDIQYNWWTADSPVNFGRFTEVDGGVIDGLMKRGRTTADEDERREIYEEVNRRFASEGYSIWLQWTLWDIGMANNVYGVLGPDLPDGGGKPFPGLATGHPVSGMWIKQ
jgi:peptide/nickel transport system substrate-binding protein